LIVNEQDSVIYSVPQKPDFFSDVAMQAQNYREIDVASADRVVALSTCSYVFQGARMVLLGKVIQIFT